jgi:hypothetical protein
MLTFQVLFNYQMLHLLGDTDPHCPESGGAVGILLKFGNLYQPAMILDDSQTVASSGCSK